MTEVHRYQVVTMLSMAGATIGYDPHGPDVVMAADFDRVTAERGAARAELALANEKIDKAWNRTTAIDHKGFIPGAMDAWKRPVPQHLPYDFSGSTSASTIQYCNGWNDSGSYWSAHAANLSKKVDALQQRLTAADERADVLVSVAKEALEELLEMKRAVGFRGQTLTVVEKLEAALKPAEANDDSCEFCKGWGFSSNSDGTDEGCGACNGTGKEPTEGGGDESQ